MSVSKNEVKKFFGFYRPHKRVQVDFSNEVSMVKPEFQDECDINNIMLKYQKSGVDLIAEGMASFKRFNGDIMDVSQYGDYHQAMNQVVAAQEAFEAMPAHVRKRFANDPGEFVNFVSDPSNLDEMVKLGIAELRPMAASTPPAAASAAKGGDDEVVSKKP